LGPRVEVIGTGQRIHAQRLSLGRQPWLTDHRVYDTAVIPGVSYVAMVLQALGLPARVEDVSFVEPLFLAEDESRERDVQLLVSRGDATEPDQFEVVSRPADATTEAWRRHATGRIVAAGRFVGQGRRIDLAAVRQHTQPVGLAELDALWGRIELRFGPSFAALTEAWVGGSVSLARIGIPAPLQPYVADEPIHAVLLDACTRVTA
ncbi:polyketide synthase dehydratase domain-containing protein, partial [Rhodoplanes sp. SY1]|uniref:polyketide synthase dehydratase domain-containing protein n=1 Tax=Rhodoplanes sp. SY1 TaxID=3166646 RepID=UPI0038B61877